MRRLIIILTVVFFFPESLLAVTPGELATRAERSYVQGRYDQAIADWRSLVEIGFVNGAIYNNLGSAYWREGKVGLARLHFLKAQALQPRNADAPPPAEGNAKRRIFAPGRISSIGNHGLPDGARCCFSRRASNRRRSGVISADGTGSRFGSRRTSSRSDSKGATLKLSVYRSAARRESAEISL